MTELVLDNGQGCAERARRFVRGCLEQNHVPDPDAYDILVAVNEAVANAHTHLTEVGGEGRIVVQCLCRATTFEVVVSDCGRGFDYQADHPTAPHPMSSSGRGLFLMNELMDEVDIDPTPSGTTVRMRRRVERNLVEH
ncbi:MAG TPA: ATP-binding protein [Actinomycetota bacterium]|nr:ATP-binding protein [Actinomycetota bacterium]